MTIDLMPPPFDVRVNETDTLVRIENPSNPGQRLVRRRHQDTVPQIASGHAEQKDCGNGIRKILRHMPGNEQPPGFTHNAFFIAFLYDLQRAEHLEMRPRIYSCLYWGVVVTLSGAFARFGEEQCASADKTYDNACPE